MARLSFLPQKVAVWAGVYFVGVLFFFIYRLLFLLLHMSLINSSSAYDIIYSFWLGFKFDSVVLSVIILPLFLLSLLPFINFSKKIWRRLLFIILILIFLIIFFVCTADLGYIDHFGSRMNYWAVDYAGHLGLFFYSLYVCGDFWLLILVWLLISATFLLALKFVIKKTISMDKKNNFRSVTVFYILAPILLMVGIRGGFGKHNLTWSDAFFGKNYFVDQMSLNSIYSIAFNVADDYINRSARFRGNSRRYKFYNDNDAFQTTRKLLAIKNKASEDNYSLTYQTNRNRNFEFSPNIVIVIMESWTAERVGILGSKLGLTPEFDSLSSRGILFTNFYANGIRTNRGIPAVLCSFPSIPGHSIMKRELKAYPFRSLAQILDENDYTSVFTYGGDIEFDNIGNFLKKVGYDKFFDLNDFDKKDYLGDWGVADHIMFARMVQEIRKFPRPFNLSIMTISNHEPYMIPDDRFKVYDDSVPDSDKLNVFYYSDWAIGKFVSDLKQYPVFDSTIFIFTADHCPHQSAEYPLDPRNFRIPLLIYSPHLIGEKPVIIEKTGSQVDIIPTLIGMLGLETNMYCWGRDLLSLPNSDSGFAIVNAERKLGMIENSMLYFHWVGAARELYDLNDTPYLEINKIDSLPVLAARMEEQLDSYMQMANKAATSH